MVWFVLLQGLLLLAGCGQDSHSPASSVQPEGPAPGDSIRIAIFADSSLDAAVRQALGRPTGSLRGDDLRSLSTLSARSFGIVDLRGIEQLDSLTALDLAGNRIVDLTPLTGLTGLVLLDLMGNQIVDLTPLLALAQLRFLVLTANRVQDIAPLLRLPRLVSVELQANPLDSLCLAEQLPALRQRGVQVVASDTAATAATESTLASWEALGPHAEELYGSLLAAEALAFDRAGVLYLGSGQLIDGRARPELFASDDGGRSWVPRIKSVSYRGVNKDDLGAIKELCLDAAQPGYMLAATSTGAFINSADGGESWDASLDLGRAWLEIKGVRFDGRRRIAPMPEVDGGYYAFSEDQSYRTADYGVTWRAISDAPSGRYCGRLAIGTGCLYSPAGEVVRRSEDGGLTWTDAGIVEAGLRYILGLEAHPLDPGLLYAVTTDGLFLSRDGASTWAALLRPEAGAWSDPELRFHPQDPSILFLFNGGDLWESADGGLSWHKLRTDLPTGLHLNDLAVDPLHPSRLYVATSVGVFCKGTWP